MITLFTQEETSLLLRMLIAHCVTDFFLQSGRGIKDKETRIFRSPALYYHVMITMGVLWVFMFSWNQWKAVAIIGITHLLIDAAKSWLKKKLNSTRYPQRDFWLFTIDQLLHVGIIILVWLALTGGYHKLYVLLQSVLPNSRWLLRVLGYLLLVGPVTYMIRFLTKKWSDDLDTTEGLIDAGTWIGILERTLILTLVFIDQFTAIGFLVAAKSILRLIDKPDPVTNQGAIPKPVFNSRKHTEYVLIGTFLSFSFAIITGLIINRILAA
jgi:hypothetical protein